jgi:hypothetical protein
VLRLVPGTDIADTAAFMGNKQSKGGSEDDPRVPAEKKKRSLFSSKDVQFGKPSTLVEAGRGAVSQARENLPEQASMPASK